ncbi:MAG: hypothetical protein FWB76_00360 [Oscillospiraceae bacterium]|nr:hypothetical protein [Oscillospiraceae bacterium]
MKTITLRMRDSPRKHPGGVRGDHRMARLVIPLPKERLREIKSCVALFSCDGEVIMSPLILPGDSGDAFIHAGQVHIVLWQRLTQCRLLRVQLECFGDFEGKQFICRTAISEPVAFEQSLADTSDLPACSTHPNAMDQLLQHMHAHINLPVLDGIGPALTNTQINDLVNTALKGISP